MKVENGKQFIILLNKRGFNQSAYQALRSVKHSLIKRPIIHLLTSKASMFLNCHILFLFNYVMLMFFIKLIQKRARVTKSKQLNLSSLCVHDKSVHMCKCTHPCKRARDFTSPPDTEMIQGTHFSGEIKQCKTSRFR